MDRETMLKRVTQVRLMANADKSLYNPKFKEAREITIAECLEFMDEYGGPHGHSLILRGEDLAPIRNPTAKKGIELWGAVAEGLKVGMETSAPMRATRPGVFGEGVIVRASLPDFGAPVVSIKADPSAHAEAIRAAVVAMAEVPADPIENIVDPYQMEAESFASQLRAQVMSSINLNNSLLGKKN